jgi:hypothetical protein
MMRDIARTDFFGGWPQRLVGMESYVSIGFCESILEMVLFD